MDTGEAQHALPWTLRHPHGLGAHVRDDREPTRDPSATGGEHCVVPCDGEPSALDRGAPTGPRGGRLPVECGEVETGKHPGDDVHGHCALGNREQQRLLLVPARVLAADPGDVQPHPHPPLTTPQQRLDDLDRLHAAGRDRAGLPLREAEALPQAVRRLRHREVEVLHELGDDHQGRHTAGHQGDAHAAPAAGEEGRHQDERSEQQQCGGRRPEQQGYRELPRRHLHDDLLRCLDRVMPQAGRAGEYLVAQGTPVAQRQVAQLDAGVMSPGDLDGHLGHREEAREQRLGDVDGLQSAQLQAALALGQHARVDAEVAVLVEPVPRVLPHQVLPAGDEDRQRDAAEHRRSRQAQPGPGERTPAEREHEHDGEGQDRHAMDDGRDGVEATSAALVDRAVAGQLEAQSEVVPDVGGRRGGHSPAVRSSPRRASRSRSAAATSGSRPGMLASVVAAAVCSWTVVTPSIRSMGPAFTSTSCIRP